MIATYDLQERDRPAMSARVVDYIEKNLATYLSLFDTIGFV